MAKDAPVELTTEEAAGALRKMDVKWRGVHVRIGGTHALRGVSGVARSGELTALMGPSGAGKTTLLSALANRTPASEGEVTFGGLSWSKALKRRVAFVEQDDVVYAELTVRQSLTFLARLRLADTDEAKITARVDETLKMLRLDGVADSLVGSAMLRGISGGERKRLCIAQELLVEPSVMLLDEPTSGLDSSMAQILVEVLRDITRKRGITIIASIHQPSSQIFHAFDQLYLVSQGEAVYAGPTEEAAAFFEKKLGLPLPPAFNPADHFMATCVDGRVKDPAQAARIAASTAERARALAKEGQGARGGSGARTLQEDRTRRYVKPWTYQLRVLLAREWALRRAALWDWQQLYLHGGTGVLAGVMWFQLGYNEVDIFSRFTAVFAVLIQWVFFPFMNELFFLPTSEVHLRKELGVGAYRLSAWYIAKSTASLLPYVIWPPLHVSIVFWMANIDAAFVSYLATLALVAVNILLFQSFSLLISTSVPAPRVMTVALLLITAMFLFTGARGCDHLRSAAPTCTVRVRPSAVRLTPHARARRSICAGIFVPLDETPLPWVGLINPLLYALQAGVALTMGQGPGYTCNDGVTEPTGFPAICRTGTETIPASVAIERYGVWAPPGLSVGVMFAFLIVFRFAAFRSLKQRMAGSGGVVAWLSRVGTELMPSRGAQSKREQGPPAASTDVPPVAAAADVAQV